MCSLPTEQIEFPNDASVCINVIAHQFSNEFIGRRSKEVLLRQLHAHLFQDGKIPGNVIDLGSWIGDNTLPWAMISHGIIYAIDPSPENLGFVKEMCDHNNIKNVRTIEAVIGSHNELVGTNNRLGHCVFNEDPDRTLGFENYRTSISLDELYRQGIIENISCIHLDVEGFEEKVLAGSEKILDMFKPLITFEQHVLRDDYIGLSRWLAQRGYDIFLINETLLGCQFDCRNLFAVPRVSDISINSINLLLGHGAILPIDLGLGNFHASNYRAVRNIGRIVF